MRDEENTKSVRDSRGRFVKGHKPLVRPKYERMRKYPKLICDTCYMGADCPEYHSGYVCAQKREFKKYKTRNVHDVMNVLCSSTNESLADMQFAMIQEAMSGEYSPEVTRLSKRNIKRLLLIYHLHRQIGNSKSTSNAKQEGILYKLFNFDIQSNDCE